MPFNLTQARTLCTMPEFKLFEAISAKAIKGLSPAEIKDKMTRARNTRDKYRDT